MFTIKSLISNNRTTKKNGLLATFFPLFVLAITSPFTFANANADEANQEKAYEQLIPYYYAAARTGDNEVISEFLNAGLPIDVKNHKGYTALMIATYNGQKNVVNTLIKEGANVCAQDNRGNTALMAAVFRGEFSIAKTLMSEDCDENQQNKAGQTAVMYASLFGREELRELLVERGADINLQDNSGNSATTIEQLNN
ncbi:ankyrin repeat domain-containing protein [Psychromonas arctica]|uniref:Ankyrin repeat domain-containing protein n=1 Tax=Psychromonas arctica TaxID=168275 RepID=A0ABU9HDY9_9GAMM